MTTHFPICLPSAVCGGVRAVGPWMPASSLLPSSRRPGHPIGSIGKTCGAANGFAPH